MRLRASEYISWFLKHQCKLVIFRMAWITFFLENRLHIEVSLPNECLENCTIYALAPINVKPMISTTEPPNRSPIVIGLFTFRPSQETGFTATYEFDPIETTLQLEAWTCSNVVIDSQLCSPFIDFNWFGFAKQIPVNVFQSIRPSHFSLVCIIKETECKANMKSKLQFTACIVIFLVGKYKIEDLPCDSLATVQHCTWCHSENLHDLTHKQGGQKMWQRANKSLTSHFSVPSNPVKKQKKKKQMRSQALECFLINWDRPSNWTDIPLWQFKTINWSTNSH